MVVQRFETTTPEALIELLRAVAAQDGVGCLMVLLAEGDLPSTDELALVLRANPRGGLRRGRPARDPRHRPAIDRRCRGGAADQCARRGRRRCQR